MERHSKIINFSLPPELYAELDRLAVASHRNRSELMRELITGFLERKDSTVKLGAVSEESLKETPGIADILKAYWIARADWPLEVVITGLVIMTNDAGEVLIGQRVQADKHVPNLSWSFPGSRLQSLDFKPELIKAIHLRTGLHVELRRVVAARVVPESGHDGTQVVGLYVYGQVQGRQHFVAHSPYAELKWVKPLEVFQYFTSSTTDEVTMFLKQLEDLGQAE